MPKVAGWINSSGTYPRLYYRRDGFRRQALRKNMTMPVHRSEYRPVSYPRAREPRRNRRNRAVLRSAMRDRDLPTVTFLISFGTPERDDHAVAMLFNISCVEAHKLGPSEPASKPQ
jgi:hypothetical protein